LYSAACHQRATIRQITSVTPRISPNMPAMSLAPGAVSATVASVPFCAACSPMPAISSANSFSTCAR